MTYKTVDHKSEAIFRDRGSKFIACVFPVRGVEEMDAFFDELREKHPRARHHCYAYRLGIHGQETRINDDGEPSGSAGLPILNALKSMDVTNTLVVVIRYFGGTKLGIPGLINAYKTATLQALSTAGIVRRYPRRIYEIKCPYKYVPALLDQFKHTGIEIGQKDFNERGMTAVFELRKRDENNLNKLFASALSMHVAHVDLEELPDGIEINVIDEDK